MSAVNLLSSLREKPTDENPDDGSNPEGEDNVVSGGGGGDPAVLAVGPVRKPLQYTRDQLMRLRNSPLVKRNLENAFAGCEALALVLKRRSDSPNEEDRGARGDVPNENHKMSSEESRRKMKSLALSKEPLNKMVTGGLYTLNTNSEIPATTLEYIPGSSFRGKTVFKNQPQDGTQVTEASYKLEREKEEFDIIKREHLSRERRAEELHRLQLKYLKEIHDLQVLKEKQTLEFLKQKHALDISRERRAEELHNLQVKFLKEKHALEISTKRQDLLQGLQVNDLKKEHELEFLKETHAMDIRRERREEEMHGIQMKDLKERLALDLSNMRREEEMHSLRVKDLKERLAFDTRREQREEEMHRLQVRNLKGHASEW